MKVDDIPLVYKSALLRLPESGFSPLSFVCVLFFLSFLVLRTN